MKKLILALLVLCFASTALASAPSLSQADFALQAEGFSIGLGLPLLGQSKPLEKLFAENMDKQSFPSCKFVGEQSNYRFGSLLAICEPIGKQGAPVIDSLFLTEDSSFQTPRGIAIGQDKEEILSAYGEPHAVDGELLIYSAGAIGVAPTLLFRIEEGKLVEIEMQQNLR